ncbi:hypothetical protein LTS10_002281 [Elasticomyces elasticus]|nr:hypothetical protein LTS10_002281 [Elasticomyces elasticus]
MLAFQQVMAFSALTIHAFASPLIANREAVQDLFIRDDSSSCMSNNNALQIGGLWVELIGNYTQDLADAVLLPGFTDYSDSALSLNSACPQTTGPTPALMSAVFENRTQFEAGQGPQPSIQSTISQVWNGCTSVTMRYQMTNLGTRPVVGLIVMDVVEAPAGSSYPYQLAGMFSEFDVGSWISNLKDAGEC